LYNVFTPTHNAVDSSIHGIDNEHTDTWKNTKTDRYVAVIEKYTLHGSIMITLTKHTHRYLTLGMNMNMDSATTVAKMLSTVAYC